MCGIVGRRMEKGRGKNRKKRRKSGKEWNLFNYLTVSQAGRDDIFDFSVHYLLSSDI
jgi:hypothetical protein